jgi:hypothetical protein
MHVASPLTPDIPFICSSASDIDASAVWIFWRSHRQVVFPRAKSNVDRSTQMVLQVELPTGTVKNRIGPSMRHVAHTWTGLHRMIFVACTRVRAAVGSSDHV